MHAFLVKHGNGLILIIVNYLGTTFAKGLNSGRFRNSIPLPCMFGQDQLPSSSFKNKTDE